LLFNFYEQSEEWQSSKSCYHSVETVEMRLYRGKFSKYVYSVGRIRRSMSTALGAFGEVCLQRWAHSAKNRKSISSKRIIFV